MDRFSFRGARHIARGVGKEKKKKRIRRGREEKIRELEATTAHDVVSWIAALEEVRM
jgi:hypothetical protein